VQLSHCHATVFTLLRSLVTPSRKPTEWLEGSCHTFTPGNGELYRGAAVTPSHSRLFMLLWSDLSHRHASALLSGLSAGVTHRSRILLHGCRAGPLSALSHKPTELLEGSCHTVSHSLFMLLSSLVAAPLSLQAHCRQWLERSWAAACHAGRSSVLECQSLRRCCVAPCCEWNARGTSYPNCG
jgi:hypothetical protein